MLDENKFRTLIVDNVFHKDNIYLYLKRIGYSENYLKNLRKNLGYIKVNDQDVFINYRLQNGDILKIYNNPNTKSCIQTCIIPLDVVYEDEEILVINKPSNLATMPTKSHYNYNLAGAICNYMQEKEDNFVCRIINRLDKDTAGLVIVAKNSLSANFLSIKNNILKTYYAICEGNLSQCITINKKIFTEKDENGIINNKRIVSDDIGKPAITHIFPIKNFSTYNLSKITIEYGRTHQIRAHMSSIGHALIGDELYGTKSALIDHSALVCKEVSLIHPISRKILHLEVDFPNDFKCLITE